MMAYFFSISIVKYLSKTLDLEVCLFLHQSNMMLPAQTFDDFVIDIVTMVFDVHDTLNVEKFEWFTMKMTLWL